MAILLIIVSFCLLSSVFRVFFWLLLLLEWLTKWFSLGPKCLFLPKNGHRWYIFSLCPKMSYFPPLVWVTVYSSQNSKGKFLFSYNLWTFLCLLVCSPMLFWFTCHLSLAFGNAIKIWVKCGFSIPAQDLFDLMTQVFRHLSFYFWTLFPLGPLKFSLLELQLLGLYGFQCVLIVDATCNVSFPWPCLCFLAWICPGDSGLVSWPRLSQSTSFSRISLFNWN